MTRTSPLSPHPRVPEMRLSVFSLFCSDSKFRLIEMLIPVHFDERIRLNLLLLRSASKEPRADRSKLGVGVPITLQHRSCEDAHGWAMDEGIDVCSGELESGACHWSRSTSQLRPPCISRSTSWTDYSRSPTLLMSGPVVAGHTVRQRPSSSVLTAHSRLPDLRVRSRCLLGFRNVKTKKI